MRCVEMDPSFPDGYDAVRAALVPTKSSARQTLETTRPPDTIHLLVYEARL
jgi:hypothetical protein